jgi:amino acid transporter
VLAGPRYLFALARDGFGPRFLASVHPRFHTPAAAILVQAAVGIPLALSGTFTGLAALSVLARLSAYLGTALAVPVLRRKLGTPEGAFRLPGGPAIPVAAALVAVGLGASAGTKNLIAAAVALVVGLGIYALRRPVEPGSGEERGLDMQGQTGKIED